MKKLTTQEKRMMKILKSYNITILVFDNCDMFFPVDIDDIDNELFMENQLIAEKFYPECTINQKNGLLRYDKPYSMYDRRKLKQKLTGHNRRLFKKKSVHNFSHREWKHKILATKGICPSCNVDVGIENLTLDHIYPVMLAYINYELTGKSMVYTIDDVQPLCKSCNCKKSASFDGVNLSHKIPKTTNQPLDSFIKNNKYRKIKVIKKKSVKSINKIVDSPKHKVDYDTFIKSLLPNE